VRGEPRESERTWGTAAGEHALFGLACGPAPTPTPGFPEVHTATWRSVEELDQVFGTCGEAAHCWCQFDRMPVVRFAALDDAHRRELLARELHRSPAPGVVAAFGDACVGWCSVAPRSHFARLVCEASTSSPATSADDPDVWSVTCFVMRSGFQRHDVATMLLDGAIDHARHSGAGWLEGYPVDTGGRTPNAADLYRGTLELFESAGFEVVARPRAGHAIVRLEL